jgi:hypothetical protein
MNLCRTVSVTGVLIFVAATHQIASAQAISGNAKVKLTGPITQEQMDQCKLDAKNRLKVA